MFCKKCGASLTDGALFCNSCGEKTGAQNAQPEKSSLVLRILSFIGRLAIEAILTFFIGWHVAKPISWFFQEEILRDLFFGGDIWKYTLNVGAILNDGRFANAQGVFILTWIVTSLILLVIMDHLVMKRLRSKTSAAS